MAKWIIVHESWHQKPEFLNADLIWRITSYNSDKQRPNAKAMIMKSDTADDYVIVNETPEELMALIDKATLLVAQASGDTQSSAEA